MNSFFRVNSGISGPGREKSRDQRDKEGCKEGCKEGEHGCETDKQRDTD